MFRSRSRLAADWFAKLRINAATNEVEQADVVTATETLETQLADANATITSLQSQLNNIDMTTIDGNLTVNGSITATGDVTAYG